MQRKKIIVSVTNDLSTDNRVDKVCVFLQSHGFDVLLVGRKRKNSAELGARGYSMKRMTLFFERGALFYAEYNFRLFLLLLWRRSDLLLSNDLDTLLANYLAARIKRNKLVYDSHEYFTEVPEIQHKPRVKKVWEGIEKWIFPKLKKVYTVNNSIAEKYRAKYGVAIEVVRNCSPLWEKKNLPPRKQLNLPEGPLIIIQGAGINVDRGAEEAVEAMQWVDEAKLVIVGDGDVVETLKNRVIELNIAEKVCFYGKRPYKEMMWYTAHAAIGLTLDKPTNLNYLYSLPNKLFDYIHAGCAIVATDLVEIAQVVRRYEVGVVMDTLDSSGLAKTLNSLLQNKDLLDFYKANTAHAKQELNWQEECKVLERIYLEKEG